MTTDKADRSNRPMEGDEELGPFFAAAMAHPPEPSADLMGRILADAEQIQDARAEAARPMPPAKASRFWDFLGGWPSVASLTTAAAAGLLIGYYPTDSVDLMLSQVWSDDTAVWAGDAFDTALVTDDLSDL
ncbi:MAG: hypothetical protein AAFQ66_18505 [Pseudomonadota bacterium]